MLFIALLISFTHGVYYSILDYKEDSFLSENFLSKLNTVKEEEILLLLLNQSFQLPSHKHPGRPPKYDLVNPLSKKLGPSAKNIVKNGGHCGRRSRLLITLLHKKNIDARKVHLINDNYKKYYHSHEYVHAVVEANIDGKWVIADPLYNLVYRNSDGDIASLDEIRLSPSIFNDGVTRANEKYVEYFEELYTYDNYRKFYWNSLPFGGAAYSFMANKIGSLRANAITTAYILEKPYLLLSVLSYMASFVIAVFLFLVKRKNKAVYKN